MAGEVQTKLTIELAGGLGVPTSLSAPVSRSAQILSPFQGMSNYAGARDARFRQELAKELAGDRESARLLSLTRERSRIRYEAEEIASAVRASEERIRRTQSLARSVRANTGFEDDFFQSGAIGRRSARVAATASKRVLKGWGAGVVAGFASSMTPGFPDDDGAVGFLGRLTMSTVSGAAWGGAPGAVAGALTTSISEIIKGLSSTDKRVEALRESMAEWRSELGKFIRDAENEMVTLRGQLEQKLREEIDAIAHKTLWQYREERFQNSNLVN